MKNLIIVLAILAVASGAWGRECKVVEHTDEVISSHPLTPTDTLIFHLGEDIGRLQERVAKLEKEVEELKNRPFIHQRPCPDPGIDPGYDGGKYKIIIPTQTINTGVPCHKWEPAGGF